MKKIKRKGKKQEELPKEFTDSVWQMNRNSQYQKQSFHQSTYPSLEFKATSCIKIL